MQASAHDISLLALLGIVQLAIPCTLSVICARVLKAPEVSLLALLKHSLAKIHVCPAGNEKVAMLLASFALPKPKINFSIIM
jgi:hypothetical protein